MCSVDRSMVCIGFLRASETRWFAAPGDAARLSARWSVSWAMRGGCRTACPGALCCRVCLPPCDPRTLLLPAAIARILVRAARTPIGSPPFRRLRAIAAPLPGRQGPLSLPLKIVALRLARRPQFPARKPSHDDVGVLALQLKRGLQLLALARAKRGRLVVDQNRPVRKARWHPDILTVPTRAVFLRPAG